MLLERRKIAACENGYCTWSDVFGIIVRSGSRCLRYCLLVQLRPLCCSVCTEADVKGRWTWFPIQTIPWKALVTSCECTGDRAS